MKLFGNKKKEPIKIDIMIDNDGNIDVTYPLDSDTEFEISVNNERTYNPSVGMKFTIPVGNLSSEEAKKKLQKLISDYNQPVNFNHNGDVTVNGNKHKKMLPFNKEIWLGTGSDTPNIDEL